MSIFWLLTEVAVDAEADERRHRHRDIGRQHCHRKDLKLKLNSVLDILPDLWEADTDAEEDDEGREHTGAVAVAVDGGTNRVVVVVEDDMEDSLRVVDVVGRNDYTEAFFVGQVATDVVDFETRLGPSYYWSTVPLI